MDNQTQSSRMDQKKKPKNHAHLWAMLPRPLLCLQVHLQGHQPSRGNLGLGLPREIDCSRGRERQPLVSQVKTHGYQKQQRRRPGYNILPDQDRTACRLRCRLRPHHDHMFRMTQSRESRHI